MSFFGVDGISYEQRVHKLRSARTAAEREQAVFEHASPVAFHGIDKLHAQGVTGRGVVGLVIEAQGVSESVHVERGVCNPGKDCTHGEKVSEVMKHVAPESTLYGIPSSIMNEETWWIRHVAAANLSFGIYEGSSLSEGVDDILSCVMSHPETLFVFTLGNHGGSFEDDSSRFQVSRDWFDPEKLVVTQQKRVLFKMWSQNKVPKNVLLVAWLTPYGDVAQNSGREPAQSELGLSTISCLGEMLMDQWRPGQTDAERLIKGTSLAAPVAAGVAVLLKQLHPSLTGHQLKECILESARPGGSGRGTLDAPAAKLYADLLLSGREAEFERESMRSVQAAYDIVAPHFRRAVETKRQAHDARKKAAVMAGVSTYEVQLAQLPLEGLTTDLNLWTEVMRQCVAAAEGGAPVSAWIEAHTQDLVTNYTKLQDHAYELLKEHWKRFPPTHSFQKNSFAHRQQIEDRAKVDKAVASEPWLFNLVLKPAEERHRSPNLRKHTLHSAAAQNNSKWHELHELHARS